VTLSSAATFFRPSSHVAVGCYGSKLRTPHLDSMAAAGLRCTKYNSAHPICSASRAAVLTGRYGLRCNTTGAFGPHSPTGTSLDETLLSNLFHEGSYKTKAFGKWHLGDAPEYLPTSRGFDSFYGVPYSVDVKPLPLLRDKTILEEETDRDILTPRYTEEAVKYIQQNSGDPFFLYLAFSCPHDPARASTRFRNKTGFGYSGDSIAEIDWSVGEILRAVKTKGIASDTLVCFTSDHGPWYQGSPGALRGRKASTFEGGFRVPFVAQWPGSIHPGTVVDTWCSSLDILPTLSSLCGLSRPPKPLDGVDFSQIFSNPESRSSGSLGSTSVPCETVDSTCIASEIRNGSCASPREPKARSTSTTAPPAPDEAHGCSIPNSTTSSAIPPKATM